MFTNFRHETGHRNVLPDPEPLLIMLIDSDLDLALRTPRRWVIDSGTGPRDTSFCKAFDKVPHQRLLHKIESYMYGISGNVAAWIGE